MVQFNREKLFDEYFESSYKHGNILTKEQLEMGSEYFDRDYQGLMPEDKEAAVLDFGCGIGDFLYHLQKKGYRNFYGVDISASQIEYCRKHISDQAECINGMDFLEDKAERYDLITAHDVMEHIPKNEVIKFLQLALRALKKGGLLIVRVPNMSSPFGLESRYSDFTHEVGFTSKSLYQVFWLAGFRDVKILSPRTIPVRNVRNLIRKVLVGCLHQWIRFCYYIQDFAVPKNLDKNIVAVGRKTKE